MPDQPPLPQDELQRLIGLFGQGRHNDAIAHAEALTRRYPRAAQLYNIMGAARAATGEIDTALSLYDKSAEIDPGYAEAHSNRGATLFQLGRYPDAVEAFETALEIAPMHPQATANLGAALCKMRRFDKAEPVLRRALQINPNNADALGSLGVTLNALGQPAEAAELHRRAIALRPGRAEDLNHLGTALAAAGQVEPALTTFRDALQIDSENADTLNNLGNLLLDLGKLSEAFNCFRKALKLQPDNPVTLNNLGVVLATQDAHAEALTQFETALRLDPAYAEAQDNRGQVLYDLRQYDAATEAFTAALRSNPDYAPALANLGMVLNDLGQRQDAIGMFEKALVLRPERAETHHSLARIKRFDADDPQIAAMLDLINRPHLRPSDRMHLCYALGHAMEDIGKFDEAFSHFSAANAQRRRLQPYDGAQDTQLIAHLKTAFAVPVRPVMAETPDAVTPIFVLGMPRSGTSLVEQILASHSDVHGAGELDSLGAAIQKAGWDGRAPSSEVLSEIAQSYRADLAELGQTTGFITDKQPLNFRWIGFIASALPEARIVHVKRDARATCWSIYKHYFSNSGMVFGDELDDLVASYRRYHDLMAFWQERYPARIITLDYDRLTEDQEAETWGLLAALDLPWQDSCLHFHKTERRVATASAHQVREELYAGSSLLWRNYEKYLRGPFARLEGL